VLATVRLIHASEQPEEFPEIVFWRKIFDLQSQFDRFLMVDY